MQTFFRLMPGQSKMFKNSSSSVGVTSEQLRKEKEKQGLSATKNCITLDNLKVDREEEAYWSLPTSSESSSLSTKNTLKWSVRRGI